MSSLHNQPVVEDIYTTFETTQKKDWSKFHDNLCSIPIEDYSKKMISVNPIELSHEDIPVFGLVPRLENYMLISCSKCSMVVKRECLHYHYNRRHNDPKNDNFSLGRFILPTVKTNKHKKQKINIRKIPEKKVIYSDSTDPIALDIIKLEFNEDDFNNFQVKIEQENENHYDSLKYDDDAGDFNFEIQSSSTSTIDCNVSDWTCKPHNQSLVHCADDILLNESIIEDDDSKLIQLSTAELTIKKELEPIICDKSSDPTNYNNTIICATNSNELLTNSIDSSKNTQNYNYMYSGFLFDDYDEIYNDPVSPEIDCSKSSSYLDVMSDTNAHNITGCNQHSTSSFGVKENIKRLLCDKLMVSTPTSQYLYSDLIKKDYSGDDVPISDQKLINPVIQIKEEYAKNIKSLNNKCSNNYSIICDQPPGITTTYNISKTKLMSNNLDASIGISSKNQVIRCKSPSLLLKNPVDVSSRIIYTKRKSYHSPGYSQSTANIANKKIKLTSNTEYLDLQTTLGPSYKLVCISDMSSSINAVNSYNQSLQLAHNQLKPVNNETQKILPSCNNSILNEFSEDKSDNDKTNCVQINKCKVVIDNDNAVSRNYHSSSLLQFEVDKNRIISDTNHIVNNYDDEQCPKSFINVKDKLKYPLLTDKPGNIDDGISKNHKSVMQILNEKEIDEICPSYTDFDFTNAKTNYTSLISDGEKKNIYIHCANTENLLRTDFKKEPDEVIQNFQDLDWGINKIKNEIISDYENIHLYIKKEPDEIVNISNDSTMTNISIKKEPNEINSDSENINLMNIKEEPYENTDFMTDDQNHEDVNTNCKHQVIRNVHINKHHDIYFPNNVEKKEEINILSKGLNTNDEKVLLTPSIKYAGIINNECSDAFINNNILQNPSLSSNVDSKYIPIIDYSDIIIDNETDNFENESDNFENETDNFENESDNFENESDNYENETDNFENELNDSELLIINQAQSACIPNSKDLDTISNGSSHNSVTSFDELSSVTSLDNDEIKLISRDCVSDDENSNDSVTSDDQLSTLSQDIIKKPKLITQTDLLLNHINYQQFINPATWADESIIKSLDVLNSKTECINCYNAAGDLLDNYFPVNSNTEIVDDFINSFTSDNSSVAINKCPVKCSIPVNSNVQMPINYLSPVSSEAQIVKNTTSAKDHELLVCDNCNYNVSNNSYYLSSFHTFKWISKSETNYTSFTNCLTHNCIIENNFCIRNIIKTYCSESYVDKAKQNENTLNRNTNNGSNYINKHHEICKNHFKRITDKNIIFRKHCKIIPHKYNIEARVKKMLHRHLEGQVVDDKENNNQLIARNLKKLKRVNFVMRKTMSCSDESDDNE